MDGVLWLPNVLNISEDVLCHCQFIDFFRNASVNKVLKGLPLLHLTFWLLSGMCCREGFSSSVSGGVGNFSVYNKGLLAMLKRMDSFMCLRGCIAKNAISTPKLPNLLLIYLGLDSLGIPVDLLFCYLSSLEVLCLHKTSVILSSLKLAHDVYFKHHPTHQCFSPWDAEWYYHC